MSMKMHRMGNTGPLSMRMLWLSRLEVLKGEGQGFPEVLHLPETGSILDHQQSPFRSGCISSSVGGRLRASTRTFTQKGREWRE